MKDTLLALLILILRACILAAAVLGFVFITNDSGITAFTYLAAMFAGVSFSLIWTFLSVISRPVIPVVIVLSTGFLIAVLLGGAVYMELPGTSLEEMETESRPEDFFVVDWSGTVLYGRNYSVYVGEHVGAELRDAVLIRYGEFPRMHYHRELYWNYLDEKLIVPGVRELATDEVAGLYRVDEPLFLSRLIEDFRWVIAELDRPVFSIPAAAHILALAFSLAMVWTLARVSRWPLVNSVLVAGCVRLIFAVPRLLETDPIAEILVERVPGYASAGGWAIFVIVLLVVEMITPRFSGWRSEMRRLEDPT